VSRDIKYKLAQGNIEAFEYLFNKYYSPLCAYARRYLKDKDAAEDIVCSLFLYLWEHRERISSISNLESYLLVAVHNSSLNKLREKSNRQKSYEESFRSDDLLATSDIDDNISDKIDHFIEEEIISTVINDVYKSLPENCKKIYILRRYDNLTYREIAEQLNISIGTVKKQLSRANKKIREALKKYTFSLFI
jgi:RNA polymerase sigma-70 factor (ECF subfamily)